MRYSELIEVFKDDLEKNGDAEAVSFGITVVGSDGNRYRLDAVIGDGCEIEVLRDPNFVNGMACLAADYKGEHQIFV